MQTLNEFFYTQQNSTQWANQVTSQRTFGRAKEIIGQELAGVDLPPAFYEKLILKLCEALDLKIGNLLVAGWRKHREIISYRDKENPPVGYHTVPLLEHTLVSKHQPTIQPVFNHVPLAKLTFDVLLKLKLAAGKLYIRDGKIFKAGTGTWTGSGSIEYKGIPILTRETATYDIPGEMDFEPPIPI
ncbi:MAG: hypothetical protein P8046_12445 [Anaerolineales bacterium]|jgi:hypothetical protein